MTNNEKLVHLFSEALTIAPELVVDSLQYNTIAQWDSTAHMVLIAQLEAEFEIMLDTDDIIDMSSVAKAREILARYDIEF